MEDGVGDVEVLVLAGAARGQEAGGGDLVRRGEEFLEGVVHLAGVDVFRLEGREDLVVERTAVAAGEGGVLRHLHLGVRIAQGHVGGVRRASALRTAGEGERAQHCGDEKTTVEVRHLHLCGIPNERLKRDSRREERAARFYVNRRCGA
jgi:hypothetical protein